MWFQFKKRAKQEVEHLNRTTAKKYPGQRWYLCAGTSTMRAIAQGIPVDYVQLNWRWGGALADKDQLEVMMRALESLP